MTLLSGRITTSTKTVYPRAVVISLKFTSSSPSSPGMALGKGQISFIVIPNQKSGRKLEVLVWRVLSKYWRELEEFRTQSNIYLENKTSKILNRSRI